MESQRVIEMQSAAHRRGAAYLSDIILGGQDGLVNVLGVILGVAVASQDPHLIIVAGLAATFAESISMGAVAYTSTLADRDYYRSEYERERREIAELPDLEREEVRRIFRGWGFDGELLEKAIARVTSNQEVWLSVMMSSELNLAPVETRAALRSALVVGASAFLGSLIPLVPFFVFEVNAGILGSLALSAGALFGMGVYKARSMVGNWRRSGAQMAAIGIASALAGYSVGLLLRVPPGA